MSEEAEKESRRKMKTRDAIEEELGILKYDREAQRMDVQAALLDSTPLLSPASAQAAARVLEQELHERHTIAVAWLSWVLGDGPIPRT